MERALDAFSDSFRFHRGAKVLAFTYLSIVLLLCLLMTVHFGCDSPLEPAEAVSTGKKVDSYVETPQFDPHVTIAHVHSPRSAARAATSTIIRYT